MLYITFAMRYNFFNAFSCEERGDFFCFVLLADINLPAPVVFAPLAVMTTLEDSAKAGRLLSKERNPVSFVNHADLL